MSHYVTFSFLSDEALLCLYRLGITYARDVLSVRYFQNRIRLVNSIATNIGRFLDEWTINEVFFNTYLTAESEYEFGKSTFRAFFLLILERYLYHEILCSIHLVVVCQEHIKGIIYIVNVFIESLIVVVQT